MAFQQGLLSQFFFLILFFLSFRFSVSLFRVLQKLRYIDRLKYEILTNENALYRDFFGNREEISNIFRLLEHLDHKKRYKLSRILEKEQKTIKYFGTPLFESNLLKEESIQSYSFSARHDVSSPSTHTRKLRTIALFLLYQPYVIILAAFVIVVTILAISYQVGITLIDVFIAIISVFLMTEDKIDDIKFMCSLFLDDASSDSLISSIDWRTFSVTSLKNYVRQRLGLMLIVNSFLALMVVNYNWTLNLTVQLVTVLLGYVFFVLIFPLTIINPLFIFVFIFVIFVSLIILKRILNNFYSSSRSEE